MHKMLTVNLKFKPTSDHIEHLNGLFIKRNLFGLSCTLGDADNQIVIWSMKEFSKPEIFLVIGFVAATVTQDWGGAKDGFTLADIEPTIELDIEPWGKKI